MVTYRYKLRPTKAQRTALGQWVGACRYAYNLCLDYRRHLWQGHKLNLSKHAAQKELAALAKDVPWLGALHSQTLQDVTDRLWSAYDGFLKAGRGFPKFARRGHYRSFAFKQGVQVHGATCTVQLPKLGKVKYRNSRPLPADSLIKRATVSQQADGWYVALCVECEVAPLPVAPNASVGVDVGIKALATLSTGERIANPRHLVRSHHKLARLQRAVSRKKKGGANRRKAIQQLARQHQRVKNTRNDFLHKLSTRLLHENQAVVTEQLHIRGMVKNHSLARAISDASWGELNRQLAYKALWYGRHHEQVAAPYTSMDCSACGDRNRSLTLAVREWACPACGCRHDRDVNAAVNIKQKAVGQTVLAWEIYSPVREVAQESPKL